MKYQLVLQLPSSSLGDYDRLLLIEETIRTGLGDLGFVDGHDIGSGEMNVFIHTDTPQLAFKKAQSLLVARQDCMALRAGYRDFKDEECVPIYPAGLRHFSIA
jgi:hypothetical protein